MSQGTYIAAKKPPTPIQMSRVINKLVSLKVLEILGVASDRANERAVGRREEQMSRVTKSVLPSHNPGRTPSLLLRPAPNLMYHQPD